MSVFLSHVSEEASEARAIKAAIENAIPGSEVFVSTIDIHFGEQWLNEIDKAMKKAKVVLALCSSSSIRRPWLNFESGGGWAKRLPVIPICHKKLKIDQLTDPFRIFDAVELKDSASCQELVERLATLLTLKISIGFDPVQMLQNLKIELPSRTEDIGIVLTHRQDQWDGGDQSVFALPGSLSFGMKGDWIFKPLSDKRAFLSEDLHRLSGLIFASPWRARLEPETIGATIEWVIKGGRLLLLGFELGDRHHDANLAELSHHFGIDPSVDIVGPVDYGHSKPYDVPVDFTISKADPHPFTEALMNIRLTNVQTLRVEPGGIEWLRVGENVVYRPTRNSVQYHDGTMTAPGGTTFEINQLARWLPVAVEAPKGLCGKGSVQMIGTWDLIGRKHAFGADNIKLISRILDWLSKRNN